MLEKSFNWGIRSVATLAIALLIAPQSIQAAQTTIGAAGAIAPPIQLTAGASLDLGEVVIVTAGSPGFFDLSQAGVQTVSNASQVGATVANGTFDITGRSGVNVDLTIAVGALTCDNTYLGGPCSGAPTFTIYNSFTPAFGDGTGQISNASCTGIRCTDTINVGGRLAFTGNEEGRWTTTLTITANYQ